MNIEYIDSGLLVNFKNSASDYLKVSDKDGNGGVVNLVTGLYIAIKDLESCYGLDPNSAAISNESIWMM